MELAIIEQGILNPHADLTKRAQNWIALLYNEAVRLLDEEYTDAREAPWILLTEAEKDASAIETLRGDKLVWHIRYHELVDSKTLEIADGLTEAIRVATGAIVANRKRKRIKWAQVSGYGEVKTLARDSLILPSGSAGRQISSFIENHLDEAEEAGVPESTTLTVLSRPDKFLINASRALSRVEKEELTEEEKKAKVALVMERAATVEHASDIRKEFLNGTHCQIPRDVVKLSDGKTLVTFVVSDEHEFVTLDRKTEAISVEYKKAQPILAETQAERSRGQAVKDLKEILGILVDGELDQDIYHLLSKDIMDAFVNSGILELLT